MNVYHITFPFLGEFEFIKMTANQLANSVIDKYDGILDAICDEAYNGTQEFGVTFYGNDHNPYYASFEQPGKLSIYLDNEDGRTLVEKDVPWLLLKIEDSNGNDIYNLTNDI